MQDADVEVAEDPERLERVLVAQQARLLGVLRRRVGSPAEAEELLHAAYARALERGLPPGDDEALVAWFLRVLRNAWIDRSRRRRTERGALEREAAERAGDAEEPDVRDAVCACFRELLPGLKPEYADLVRQVDLEGKAVSEVARATGITANAASVRLHRARRALKDRLLRACGACAAHGCLECGCRRR